MRKSNQSTACDQWSVKAYHALKHIGETPAPEEEDGDEEDAGGESVSVDEEAAGGGSVATDDDDDEGGGEGMAEDDDNGVVPDEGETGSAAASGETVSYTHLTLPTTAIV